MVCIIPPPFYLLGNQSTTLSELSLGIWKSCNIRGWFTVFQWIEIANIIFIKGDHFKWELWLWHWVRVNLGMAYWLRAYWVRAD